MLRVTLDLEPWGSQENKKHLGRLEIVNDGTGDEDMGNYRVKIIGANGIVENMKYITGYPRKLGAWYLVGLAISYCEGTAVAQAKTAAAALFPGLDLEE
jgi:hypothetical protein